MAKKTAKINIGGKERYVRFGVGLNEMIIENERPEGQNIYNVGTSKRLYYALKFAHEVRQSRGEIKSDIDFDRYDVIDWIDEIGMNSEPIQKFEEEMLKSMIVHLPEEEKDKVQKELKKAKKKATKNGG